MTAELQPEGWRAVLGRVVRRGRLAGSTRLRITRLLWETSPALALTVGVFVLADGILPNLALVAIGTATGRIPASITHGLGSSAGTALLASLAIGAGAYALSLMRSPVQDLLSAYCEAVMASGMQRRLAAAVCTPAGIEHLEDPEILDQLSSASGELSSTRPADAPMALAGILGDRVGGLLACAVLASFHWWLGLFFLVGWSLIRPPLRGLLADRATLARRATPELRHSWYYLGCAWGSASAKEMRVFNLGDWVLGRHRKGWLAGMSPSWGAMRRFEMRSLTLGGLVVAMYVVGTGSLGLAAYHHQIGLGTIAVMLPMLALTMQVGGVSYADVSLEQMLAAVPDLDGILAKLEGLGAAVEGTKPADGLPEEGIRFESVSYRYPHGDHRAVLDNLDLDLPAGHSLALVGVNGAGKTTLVTLLGRLRDPTDGRITVDGIDLRELDPGAWQRLVAVVYQDFCRYPLTLRENVAFADLGGETDEAALQRAAVQADLAPVLDRLPLGWDSVCSPGYRDGTDLSGGQWQRIALARALYSVARGARLLVLDEPTAQLDVRAEAAFYDRFLEMTSGVTTVVISHRFSTVRRAERIAVLDGGRITELGSHAELVAAGGTYATMFELQASRFAEAGTKTSPDA